MPEINDQGTLVKFFSRPVVGITGSIASIVGILLSGFLFLASRENPELTYFVHPAKAVVVRTGQTSRLSFQFDGQPFVGDVTAAQVAFWNAGRRSIRGTSILKPLVIRTSGGTRILEARLQKTSRDVSGITIDSSHISSGEVEIRWNILEQNDGGVVQIVYAGDEAVTVHAQAVLEGQRDALRLEYARSLATPGEEYSRRQGWKAQVPNFLLILIGIMMTIYSIWISNRKRRRGQALQRFEWLMLSQGPVFLVLAIWLLWHGRPPGPPFGF
jgi:hypothetical protein